MSVLLQGICARIDAFDFRMNAMEIAIWIELVMEIDASFEDFLSKNNFFTTLNASERTAQADRPSGPPEWTTNRTITCDDSETVRKHEDEKQNLRRQISCCG